MVEVFITDIQSKIQAESVLYAIRNNNPGLKINLDFNETDLDFPCGHTLLRVEGENINSENILTTTTEMGFRCAILEDKICVKDK